MFKEKTCPNCMSLYRGNKCKNCGYSDKEEKDEIRVVWKFIIAYMIFQVFWGTFTSNFVLALFVTLTAWFILLLIPCILKYGFRVSLSRKLAILYTLINAFILLLGNIVVDILCKEYLRTQQTTTIWNILMMIVPYYILTDAPIFGAKKDNLQKEENNNKEKQIESFKIKVPKFKIPQLPQIKLTNNMTIVIAVLIVAVAYIFVEQNKLNYKEKVRQENIAEQQELQEALDSCLDSAEINYSSYWDSECELLGRKKNCALPSYNADRVEKSRINARKECMDKYKNKAF